VEALFSLHRSDTVLQVVVAVLYRMDEALLERRQVRFRMKGRCPEKFGTANFSKMKLRHIMRTWLPA